MPSADDILKLLDQVAARLQGPAEQVFNLYVARVLVESLVWLIIGLIILAICVIAFAKWKVVYKATFDSNEFHKQENAQMATGLYGFIVVVIAILDVTICVAPNAINALTPQYGALARIVSQLTGH